MSTQTMLLSLSLQVQPSRGVVVERILVQELVKQLNQLSLARRVRTLCVKIDVHDNGPMMSKVRLMVSLLMRNSSPRAHLLAQQIGKNGHLIQDSGQEGEKVLRSTAEVGTLAHLFPFLVLRCQVSSCVPPDNPVTNLLQQNERSAITLTRELIVGDFGTLQGNSLEILEICSVTS